MDTKVVSTITSHGPGYLDKSKETIVGFQTDKPFKRSLQPYGGIRMAEKACADNGYKVDPEISQFFTLHRKTHNAGVFDAYTPEMRACRSSHIITGLPDAYGRGRIIGDYRRVALYGVDRLIQDKEEQKMTTRSTMYSHIIRIREELSEQIRALNELKDLGRIYGYDISRPAGNVQEAIQWTYFAYLAAVKEQGLEGEAKRAATELATLEADSKLYRSHFAFPATLAIYLTPEQVEAVKDGMTYGVLMVTYRSTLDMIPSLTDEEKAQIKAWLTEARDLAIDAESSNKKHGVFGKYKGRINNYLTKRGYDLKAERAAWYKRIEARKQAEAAAAK